MAVTETPLSKFDVLENGLLSDFMDKMIKFKEEGELE